MRLRHRRNRKRLSQVTSPRWPPSIWIKRTMTSKSTMKKISQISKTLRHMRWIRRRTLTKMILRSSTLVKMTTSKLKIMEWNMLPIQIQVWLPTSQVIFETQPKNTQEIMLETFSSWCKSKTRWSMFSRSRLIKPKRENSSNANTSWMKERYMRGKRRGWTLRLPTDMKRI